eukprot:Gb_41478 [translate_table: standard]
MKEGEIGKEKENFLLGKSRYKFWALAIIIFLAFWSMLSGSASLKWSAGNLMLFSEELDKRLQDDFDVLVFILKYWFGIPVKQVVSSVYTSVIKFRSLISSTTYEIEAREKIVRHMWDIYTHNPRLRLSRFWQEAFEAAYEELESEVPGVKESAISEIAKMSLRLVDMDPVAQKMGNPSRYTICG